MPTETTLLIIGAGPFGLAIGRYAKERGVDYLQLGRSMEFWKANMPAGMYLRSACDWHLDPLGVYTIESYLAEAGRVPADVEPLSLDFYLGYTAWFQRRSELDVDTRLVERLNYRDGTVRPFRATLDDGTTVAAAQVAIAPGFRSFQYVPDELAAILPEGSCSHTCECVDLAALRGKRCLIIGGRQSAFEWAALLGECGAEQVYVSHRHPSPAFAEADWSWVTPLVERIAEDPGWFRRLRQAEQDELNHRLWLEGRAKVEPWLEARVIKDGVEVLPNTRLVSCTANGDGSFRAELDDRRSLAVDHVILATGYKPEINRLPLLRDGDLLPRITTRNGFPALDENFQTSVPGLYITSMPATQDFGSFLAFTVSARASATVIGRAVESQQRTHGQV